MALMDQLEGLRRESRRMTADEIGYPRGMTGVKFNPRSGTYDTFAARSSMPRRRIAGQVPGQEYVYDIEPPEAPARAAAPAQPAPVMMPPTAPVQQRQVVETTVSSAGMGPRTGIASLFMNSPNQMGPRRRPLAEEPRRVYGGGTKFAQINPIKVDGRSNFITKADGKVYRVERTGGLVKRGMGGVYKSGARLVEVNPQTRQDIQAAPQQQAPAAAAGAAGNGAGQPEDFDAELRRIMGMTSPFEEQQA